MKVSVIITTYNHENYISQCLESVLKQTGNFWMEIIVGDDCSTDNTRAVVNEYMEKYPKAITLLPPDQNLGVTKNLKRCLDECSGEYLAICEGDDYWTDISKLQKQIDFLEIHFGCSMCFSALKLYYEDTNTFIPHPDQVSLKKNFITTDELIECNYIGNFSCCMYRADVIRNLQAGIFDLYTVDWFFNISCGEFGNIGFIPEGMSVYRLHTTGTWTGKGELEKLNELKQNIETYNKFLNYRHDIAFSKLRIRVEEEIERLNKEEASVPISGSIDSSTYLNLAGKIKASVKALIHRNL